MRYGSNPGTVRVAGQRVAIRVPRVRGKRGELALRSYQALHGPGEIDERLLKRVLYGISCRNYALAAEAIPGAIGLSSSSVSRAFVEASAAQLKQFQERDLSAEKFVALLLDGKTFAEATMVVAMGWVRAGRSASWALWRPTPRTRRCSARFCARCWSAGWICAGGCWWSSTGARGCVRRYAKCFRSAPWCSAVCGTSART